MSLLEVKGNIVAALPMNGWYVCIYTVVSRLLVPIAICSLHSITRHVINERHSSSFRIQNSNCVSTLRTNGAHAIRILNTK